MRSSPMYLEPARVVAAVALFLAFARPPATGVPAAESVAAPVEATSVAAAFRGDGAVLSMLQPEAERAR